MDKALAKIRLNMRTSGLNQIDKTLEGIERQLISSRLNLLDILTLQGRCRELRAARWLVNRVLYPQDRVKPIKDMVIINKNKQSVWGNLHDSCLRSLQTSLENQTLTPLEIDILREDQKRELLITILEEFDLLLEELQSSKLDSMQLSDKMPLFLSDLWRSATTKFLGKYYTLTYNKQSVEVVNVLLEEQKIVEKEILAKIPFVFDLINYLLFKNAFIINNTLYEAQTPEAIARAESILNNLLIQVANAVMQPLLNNFADVEEIKQKYYSYHLMATREVERFRNNLSWHYRLQSYWSEAQAIYESQFHLFTFTESGIKKLDVYAPRSQELMRLSGIPLVVTLWLELQDAIAPRLKTITEFIGRGLVYVLKNIIGKGIGLIGRGVLQGIGDSFSVGKVGRRSDRL